MKARKNTKTIALSLAALAAVGVTIGAGQLNGSRKANAEPDGKTPAAAEQKAPAGNNSAAPVETVPAKTGEVAQYTAVTGSLIAEGDVTLSSKLSGRLAAVLVRQGDVVRPGQVIARLDTTDLAARVRSAQDAVAAAQARVLQAEAVYRQQLVQSRTNVESAQAILRQQEVNTRTGIESAQADVESARARLSQVREGARQQEVGQADAKLSVARANLSKATADRDRYKNLMDEGAVARAAYEQYQTAYEVAAAEVRAAEQSLSLVREGARSQEIAQAEQALRQAEERLRQAKATTAQEAVRGADLAAARAGRSQNDVRAAEVKAARASLGQAHSELVVARQALADADIRTPLGGQVAARTAEPGQVVAPGGSLVRIVALNTVYFEAKVPERELGVLRPGQPVDVTVDTYPNRTFAGSISKLYPAGSTASRAFPVRISLTNSERLLRPEMFARGRIAVAKRQGAVLVPRESLLPVANGAKDSARLFTAQNGIARETRVTLGLLAPDGKWVEVRGGIAPETPVITMGHRSLNDGDKVAPMSAPAETPKRVATITIP
jgi:RND family efflux transporter MFP subunit